MWRPGVFYSYLPFPEWLVGSLVKSEHACGEAGWSWTSEVYEEFGDLQKKVKELSRYNSGRQCRYSIGQADQPGGVGRSCYDLLSGHSFSYCSYGEITCCFSSKTNKLLIILKFLTVISTSATKEEHLCRLNTCTFISPCCLLLRMWCILWRREKLVWCTKQVKVD